VVLGVRPERFTLGAAQGCDGKVSAVVDVYESLGAERVIWATAAGQTIAVRAPIDTARPPEGGEIMLGFDSASASLFDASTGLRV
jgi:ABC-type sugar transport system ATPase subunit